MANFGELLAELRQDRNLTQDQLAKIIFVTAGTISNYENNIHFPDVEKLICLADYFDVTTDYLLGRTNQSISPKVFNEEFVAGKTIGGVVSDIKKLSVDRRKALLLVLQDMKFGMVINQYNTRGNT